MTYVISDVHGCYGCFLNFLQHIRFSDDDTLYIIGDLIDRGPDGIALLQDVMQRKNVVCLKGNHEKMIYPALERLCNCSPGECRHIIFEELANGNIGQGKTLDAFCTLPEHEKRNILDFIRSMPLFLRLQVAGQSFLLVHGGLPDFDDLAVVDYYSEDELLFGPHNFSLRCSTDTTVIVGHHPTRLIRGAVPDFIYKANGNIDLDCGLGFGGQLGALCLDTGKEIYIKP